jgi:hypothetical protein
MGEVWEAREFFGEWGVELVREKKVGVNNHGRQKDYEKI